MKVLLGPPRAVLRLSRIDAQTCRLLPHTDLIKALARTVSILQAWLSRLLGLSLPLSVPRTQENVEKAWRAYDLHRKGLSFRRIARELFPDQAIPEDYTTFVKRLIALCSRWIKTLKPQP